MAIVYEGYGNILTHEAQSIVIPVNTVGIMGAGLALAARNRIWNLNSFYKSACQDSSLTIGKVLSFKIAENDDGKQVLLFPSKGHWKDDSKIENIEEALKYLVDHLNELEVKSLAIPPVGCGLGKLDYSKSVRPLFQKYLDPLDIDVHVLLRDGEVEQIEG